MSDPFGVLPDPHDERELYSLVKRERLARDTADWETLESSYWADAMVRVTWFEGSISEFVDVSRERAKRGSGMHIINPIRCAVHGDRALVESQGQILIRPQVDGVSCDITSWCRFFSRAERRNGHWRLSSFDSIYTKDRIDPVDPEAHVSLDPAQLASARPSYRHLAYLNLRGGYPVSSELPGDDDRELVASFYAEAVNWMRHSGDRS